MKRDFHEDNGWTKEDAQAFAVKCVHALADNSALPELYGFGAAMIVPRTENDRDRKLLENQAFTLCFATILVNAINFLRRWRPRVTAVHFVHDKQPGMEGQLQDAFSSAKTIVGSDCDFHISSLHFADSKSILPLQAADILAYETRKEVVNRLEVPQRARSRALAHLIAHRPHVGFYVDQPLLEAARDAHIMPPVLYESAEARQMLPWIERSREIDPPPLLP